MSIANYDSARCSYENLKYAMMRYHKLGTMIIHREKVIMVMQARIGRFGF